MPRRIGYILAAVLGATAVGAGRADAAILTLGSDLRADATIVEAHQQDSAFWAQRIRGAPFAVPADGQVVAIRLKGSVLRERGAAEPLDEVHFQTLRPLPDGTMQVALTSQPFRVPIDGPQNQITTFYPENLCARAGDSVAFNDEGGWAYAGPGALDFAHYVNGAPFRVFGAVADSSTWRYSLSDGTNNGAIFSAPVLRQGSELLMQVDLATGADASEPCGGPRRHPDGSLVITEENKPEMHVIVPQRAYVRKNRRFAVGVYCEADAGCRGVAAITRVIRVRDPAGRRIRREQIITRTAFGIAGNDSGRIGMRLSRKLFAWLRNGTAETRSVRCWLVSTSGRVYTARIRINH